MESYFCTPVNCTVFARLGVDGVHYAYLNTKNPEEAPIFLVNPMAAGQYVVPVANHLVEFLSLVISTKDAAVLEYVWSHEKEAYHALLEQAAEELEEEEKANQAKVCETLREEFQLHRIEDTYEYVRSHVEWKLVEQLQYSEEYYEYIDE